MKRLQHVFITTCFLFLISQLSGGAKRLASGSLGMQGGLPSKRLATDRGSGGSRLGPGSSGALGLHSTGSQGSDPGGAIHEDYMDLDNDLPDSMTAEEREQWRRTVQAK